MTSIDFQTSHVGAPRQRALAFAVSSSSARLLLVAVLVGLTAAGFLATDSASATAAVTSAGADLTRLLRFMTVIKAGLVVGAAGAVFWRLGTVAPWSWFTAYALACGAMATGPGLIWSMVHVGLGALLLHGGLVATVLLLWRDPAVARRMEAILMHRRARIRSPGPRR